MLGTPPSMQLPCPSRGALDSLQSLTWTGGVSTDSNSALALVARCASNLKELGGYTLWSGGALERSPDPLHTARILDVCFCVPASRLAWAVAAAHSTSR
jgi:hypothetical protein